MRQFITRSPPARIIFGPGCVAERGAAEIDALGGCTRIILIGSPRALTSDPAIIQLRAQLAEKIVGVFDDLKEHVPAELVQEKVKEVARLQADSLLVIGGGSPLGLAKALAACCPPPPSPSSPHTNISPILIISIPTTYSGSEVTAYHGVLEQSPADGTLRKVAKRMEIVRPLLVLYDAHLVRNLPYSLAVSSSFNALAHAFEALWASYPQPSPLAQWAATESIRTLFQYLPQLLSIKKGEGGAEEETKKIDEINNELLYAAYLGGYSLDAEDLSLQHRLAHVLGGSYHLPHAEVHRIILPYVIWFFEEGWGGGGGGGGSASSLLSASPLAGLFQPSSSCVNGGVAGQVYDLEHTLLASTQGTHTHTQTQTQPPPAMSLKALGLQEQDLEGVVDKLLAHGGLPPRPDITLEDKPRLLHLLHQAYTGTHPSSTNSSLAPPSSSSSTNSYNPPPSSTHTHTHTHTRTPRITYLTNEAFLAQDPQAAEKILARRKGHLLNLDRVLMHAPAVAQGWNGMFGSLRSGLVCVDGRLRELVILRVAVINRAYYEWFQHVSVFLEEGGTEEEAGGLGGWRGRRKERGEGGGGEGLWLFSEKDCAVLAYVDEMTKNVQVRQETVDGLMSCFWEEEEAEEEGEGGEEKQKRKREQVLVELTALCAGYNMVSRFLEALHLTPEEGGGGEGEEERSLPGMPVDEEVEG